MIPWPAEPAGLTRDGFPAKLGESMGERETIRYSVVVPFFNEQESIPPLYVKLTEAMEALAEPYELIFVDDGSRDQSFKVLAQIQENDGRVHVVRLRRNFGQTAALKAGFDFARGEIILTMDGDLQDDPEDIPVLLAKMREGYDIVSGWRRDRKEPWLTRRVPSRTANWIMAKISGVPLHDFGATFKAYRREIVQDLPLYGELHRFIPALASWQGAHISEVVIRNHPRKAGKSKYGIGRTTRVLLDLFTVKFLLDYSTKPLQFFGLFGLGALFIGGVINLYLLYEKLLYRVHLMIEHGPLMLLGIALVIAGIQFLSLGLIGEIVARTYYESQGKPIYAVREVRSRRAEAEAADVHDTDPSKQ
jgi:glycosyltransferase involved in cell wall biosynthesis